MKIKKIEIENFKGIEKVEIDSSFGINAFIGPNGSGKTSIIQALEFVFGNKNISKKFIRKGEEKAIVTVQTDAHTYTKILSSSKNVAKIDNSTVTLTQFQNELEEESGVSVSDFQTLSTSQFFNEMNSQNLAKFLSEKSPIKLDFDTLASLLPLTVSEDALMILQDNLGLEFTPEELNKCYSSFFADRKEKKRRLKEAGKLEEVLKPFYSPEDVKKIEKDIMDKEVKAKAYDEKVKAYQSAKKIYDTALSNQARLKQQMQEAKVIKPDNTVVSDLENQVQIARQTISDSESQMATIKANVSMYQKTLDNLGTNVCPISAKLICSTDKTSLKEELTELVARNKAAARTEWTRMEQAKKTVEENTQKLKSISDQIVKYNQYIALKKQFEAYTIPKMPEPPIKEEVDMDLIAMQKEDLLSKKRCLNQYEAFLRQKEEYKKMNDEVNVYEELVEITNPKGDVIQAVLSKFFKNINSNLVYMTKELKSDFEVKFIPQNGVKCLCSKDGITREYSDLSNGEKAIVTIIVISALNLDIHSPFLFVDNLNELDLKSISNVVEMLLCQTIYSNVFLASIDYENICDLLPECIQTTNLH